MGPLGQGVSWSGAVLSQGVSWSGAVLGQGVSWVRSCPGSGCVLVRGCPGQGVTWVRGCPGLGCSGSCVSWSGVSCTPHPSAACPLASAWPEQHQQQPAEGACAQGRTSSHQTCGQAGHSMHTHMCPCPLPASGHWAVSYDPRRYVVCVCPQHSDLTLRTSPTLGANPQHCATDSCNDHVSVPRSSQACPSVPMVSPGLSHCPNGYPRPVPTVPMVISGLSPLSQWSSQACPTVPMVSPGLSPLSSWSYQACPTVPMARTLTDPGQPQTRAPITQDTLDRGHPQAMLPLIRAPMTQEHPDPRSSEWVGL